MKKIVIIGDSLSLPRKLNDDISILEHTWPVLLGNELRTKKIDNIIYNRSTRRRMSASLKNNEFQESIVFCEPDAVIFQVGIVDCMPRVMSLSEYNFVNNRFFPKKLRDIIINKKKKNRTKIEIKDSLEKVYVKPEVFNDKLNNFVKKLINFNKNMEIIIIPILINVKYFQTKSPAAEHNVDLYNNEISKIISNFKLKSLETTGINNIKDFFSTDGYHLNINGHKYISEQLVNLLTTDKS